MYKPFVALYFKVVCFCLLQKKLLLCFFLPYLCSVNAKKLGAIAELIDKDFLKIAVSQRKREFYLVVPSTKQNAKNNKHRAKFKTALLLGQFGTAKIRQKNEFQTFYKIFLVFFYFFVVLGLNKPNNEY